MSLDAKAKAFLNDAHKNHHRGGIMLRRWAMARNGDRRTPGGFIGMDVLNRAIELDAETEPTLPLDQETT